MDTTCQRFNFANMPPGYRQEPWEAKNLQPGNKKKSSFSHPGYETGKHARDGGNPLNQVRVWVSLTLTLTLTLTLSRRVMGIAALPGLCEWIGL